MAYIHYNKSARDLASKTLKRAKNIVPDARALARGTLESTKKVAPCAHAFAVKTLDSARRIAPDAHALAKKMLKSAKKIALIIIIMGLIGIFLFYIENLFGSPRDVALKIRGMGFFGPVAVIAIVALEVIIAPLPGALVIIGTGYAFGTLKGTILAYTGTILGTTIAFFLSRRFGRPLAERILNGKKMLVYDYFFREYGKTMLWFVFLFPVFPTDIVTFAAGLSGIKWKDFMLIVGIAYIPNMVILNYFGSSIFKSGLDGVTTVLGIAILSVLLLGMAIYAYLKKKAANVAA